MYIKKQPSVQNKQNCVGNRIVQEDLRRYMPKVYFKFPNLDKENQSGQLKGKRN